MILIDDIREYSTGPRGWRYWCHMASDDFSDEGMEQLHLLAVSIGLRREWFQNHPKSAISPSPPGPSPSPVASWSAGAAGGRKHKT